MPRRRAILPTAMFTLVVIGALAQATRMTLADDECLAKPNGPAPQGEHWYYRIDHANNKRKCWRLAEEGLPVQKETPASEETTTAEPEPPQQPRAPKAVIAAPARPSANAAPVIATNPAATAAVPWPDAPKAPAWSQVLVPVLPQAPTAPRTASADDSVPPVTSGDAPAVPDDPSPSGNIRDGNSQRPAVAPPQSAAAPQQFAGFGQAFILMIVMFVLLAVTGPILHFTHRQRQREVVDYKPPRWAPAIPMNEAAPRVRVTQHAPDPVVRNRPARRIAPQVDQADWRPAPNLIPTPAPQPPARPAPPPAPPPPDPNEGLRYALQQLVDQIQTIQPIHQDPASGHTRRANIEMLKNAR